MVFADALRGISSGLRSAARLSKCLTGLEGIQKPERSGLPSAVLRVGALRSTFPSGVRGMFFHGYGSHCACAAMVIANTKTRTAKNLFVMTAVLFIMTPF